MIRAIVLKSRKREHDFFCINKVAKFDKMLPHSGETLKRSSKFVCINLHCYQRLEINAVNFLIVKI